MPRACLWGPGGGRIFFLHASSEGKCRPICLPSPLPIREVIAVTLLHLPEREENLPEQVREAEHPTGCGRVGMGLAWQQHGADELPGPPSPPSTGPRGGAARSITLTVLGVTRFTQLSEIIGNGKSEAEC